MEELDSVGIDRDLHGLELEFVEHYVSGYVTVIAPFPQEVIDIFNGSVPDDFPKQEYDIPLWFLDEVEEEIGFKPSSAGRYVEGACEKFKEAVEGRKTNKSRWLGGMIKKILKKT